MFTGIITNLGRLTKKEGSSFTFNTDYSICKKLKVGTSIAVNGVCLTVLKTLNKNFFSTEVMPETKNKTMLGSLKTNDLVNLELPLTPTDFISGHIVQGHIDGVSKLLELKASGSSRILKFSAPPSIAQYITQKGSIAVNGISLTIIEAGKNFFTVGILPYTWMKTMLHTIKKGDLVNIEVDILAKYVEERIKKL